MSRLLLLIITILSTSQLAGGFVCGGVQIDHDSICVCGDTKLTMSDNYDETDCCGKDTCYVDQDGNGQCPDGQVCKSWASTSRCGDLRIPFAGHCQCGYWKIDSSSGPQWCCPSSYSSCVFEDGKGICINGTVKTDDSAKCPSGVTKYGHNRNCKDNFCCEVGSEIDRDQICLGTLKCKDGTDLGKT